MTSSSPDYFAFLEPWFCVSPSTFCPGPWVNSVGHLCTPPVGEVVTAPNSLVAPTIMSLPEKACAPQFRAETTVPFLLPLWLRWSWPSGPSCHEGRSLLSEWPCSQCGSPRSSRGTDSPRPDPQILKAWVCSTWGSITPVPLQPPLPMMEQEVLTLPVQRLPRGQQANSDKLTSLQKPSLTTALRWSPLCV